jgi:hypothetical protein
MDGWPAGLRTILDAPDRAQGGDPRSGARMLAARVRVTARRTRRQTRLRMRIDTRMWGLSARPACREIAPGAVLTITAFSALRPLKPQAIGQWL